MVKKKAAPAKSKKPVKKTGPKIPKAKRIPVRTCSAAGKELARGITQKKTGKTLTRGTAARKVSGAGAKLASKACKK